MSAEAELRVRVIAAYQAPYADPIRATAGEAVTVDGDKKTDIPGWVWCTDRLGRGGWVPERYLERHGTIGRLRCDYDAIELTIQAGEMLIVHKEESGFFWATDRTGRQGWVPVTHVEAVEAGSSK